MNDQPVQEYDDNFMTILETVWGEGFMSPGGVEEVDRYLRGLDLRGQNILDIGCGLGGVDIHLLKFHGAASVTGIDIEQPLIDRCNQLAGKYQLEDRSRFVCVEPGPLPFEANSYDMVTSKDSIIHIPDKAALAADIYRVLKPGGWFAASDWLAGYEDQPSSEMQAYLEAEGLDFGLASAQKYRTALETAGFHDIELVDRNDWYRQQVREERKLLAGDLYATMTNAVGKESIDHEIEVWDKMIVAVDQGQLRPTHLRGMKPE